jgi:hypothetical protein
MGKEDDVFGFAQLGPAVSDPVLRAPGAGVSWRTPVRFDTGLLKKLITRHDALEARVGSLVQGFKRNRAEAWRVARECAGQLHELRRVEALLLYPVLARGVSGNAEMSRRLVNLRFAMNGLARRVLRSIEELAQAIRNAADLNVAVGAVIRAFAEYRRRNESELYALYDLMDPRLDTASAQLARVKIPSA